PAGKHPPAATRLQQPGLGREQVVAAQAEGGLGEQPGATGTTAKAALGLSGDDLLAAQARLLEARGGWWVLSSRR
ncbi:hypothetical protein L7Q76_31915, partial [Pseudomonas aeruginosa]|nr:hypothetical protein [Pseudomonas aeruginosa]